MIPLNLYINENIDTNVLFTEEAIIQYLSTKGYAVSNIGNYDFNSLDSNIHQAYTEDYVPFNVPANLLNSPITIEKIDDKYVVTFYDRDQVRAELILEPYNYEQENREKRNQLLKDTDWIESNSEITEDCKKAIRAYRQLLRDIFQIVDATTPIVFPSMPKLVFSYKPLEEKQYSGDLESLLQSIEVEDTNRAQWNLFLQEWTVLDKPLTIALLINLSTIYCPQMTQTLYTLLNV